MLKSLLKLAFILVVGILVYNYFLGSDEEKATSEKVFRQVKEVGRTVGDLVKQEKEKFDDGKYDKAFDNLGKIYENLKGQVDDPESREDKEKLEELEHQKEVLEKETEELKKELDKENPDEEKVKEGITLDEELKRLVDETTSLFEKVMKKQKERADQE